jgi:hypothetical protein
MLHSTSHSKGLEKSGRSTRVLGVLAVVFAILLVLVIGGLRFLRADRFAGYSVPPPVFRAQADALRPGMSEAEVFRAVSRWDEVSTSTTRIRFTIRPKQRHGLIMPRIDEHIEVELDEELRLKSFRQWDG